MYEAGIVYRKPLEGDREQLANLILRFYRFNEEFDPAWALAGDADNRALSLADRYIAGEGYTIVADHEGELTGFIHAYVQEYPLLENSKQAVIVELYVKPQYRGRGIATGLLEKLMEAVSSDGISVVTAMFPTANFVAERFYSKRKFRRYLQIYLREV
ncbi:MAG: GNAT family N-acetyltransferase [Desulfurococcales archaeon]|nr:GNAT family N-acetyltransferase [Desulfurococcales archaeon]